MANYVNCVLGMVSGHGKTTLTVHTESENSLLCIRRDISKVKLR